MAREGNLEKIDLDSQLASNLYQILKNRNSKVSVDWNQNIGNSYALEYNYRLFVSSLQPLLCRPFCHKNRQSDNPAFSGPTHKAAPIPGFRGMFWPFPDVEWPLPC